MIDISREIERCNRDIYNLQMQSLTGNMSFSEARAEIEELKIKRDKLYVQYIAGRSSGK